MPYDSKAVLEARLTEIRTAITKARQAQSYTVGANEIQVLRANLKLLLDEEQWVLTQISECDATTSNAGGRINRVQFGRPA